MVWLAAAATVLLLCSLSAVNGEVCVGALPTWQHAVRGDFCIIDESTIVIRHFYYDSGGPDAHLYWYPIGNSPPYTSANNIPHGVGNRIPHPESTREDGRFPQDGFITDETLQFSLPNGVYACDMAVFTIWCRQANQHFTGIDIPASTFTTDPSEAAAGTKILCTRGVEPTTEAPPTEPPSASQATTVPLMTPSPTPSVPPTTVPPTPPQPSEVCVGELPTIHHAVSGQLCIIDQYTMIIKNFNYDTGGPDAHFYAYRIGNSPPFTGENVQDTYNTEGGTIINYPETGGALPFNEGFISNATVQFTLPEDLYACDIAVFTVWCRLASVQFSVLEIPQNIFTDNATDAAENGKIFCNRVPITQVTPTTPPSEESEFDNCEQLDPGLTVEWTVDWPSESVLFRLCGCTSSNPQQDDTWLGFGLSGSSTRTSMLRADATIVWVDSDSTPHAEDYYLSNYVQCRGGSGACPDTVDTTLGETCTNDALLVSGTIKGREQCVTFYRDFTAGDGCDRDLDPGKDMYVVWGIGALGETAFKHFARAESGDPPIQFGRMPSRSCSALQCSDCDPFENEQMIVDSNVTFVAQIGPSGDQRGYLGITGNAGWGIAWYINDTLIPELVVQRGKTYTFIVFGGDDSTQSGNYHPFYITDSESGGYLLNDGDKEDETVYAGFNGVEPLGVGPLCAYASSPASFGVQQDCRSQLREYEAVLTPPDPNCGQEATSNSFTWTPDKDTPNLVYYQCASHLNLGWKIRVQDATVESSGFTVHASLASLVTALALLHLMNY